MGRIYEVRKEAMAKTQAKKTKVYSRYGKEIYMTAKKGGTNLESNLALKHLIERAKKEDVPADIIQRNIKKAEGSDEIAYDFQRYEGFGPGGSAILVDTLTDNVNRTVSEVRHAFTKHGSKLGVKGSVEHMYDHLSKLFVKGADEERLLEILLENDLEVKDVTVDNGGFLIVGSGFDLDAIEAVLRDNRIEIVWSESGWYPQTTVPLEGEAYETFEKMIDMLNEIEDVQDVYHNVEPKDDDT